MGLEEIAENKVVKGRVIKINTITARNEKYTELTLETNDPEPVIDHNSIEYQRASQEDSRLVIVKIPTALSLSEQKSLMNSFVNTAASTNGVTGTYTLEVYDVNLRGLYHFEERV